MPQFVWICEIYTKSGYEEKKAFGEIVLDGIAKELEGLNLGGKVVDIQQEDKGTLEDWAVLEKNIALRIHENEIMMTQSELNAARSALC